MEKSHRGIWILCFVIEGLAVTVITEVQTKTLEVNRIFFGSWLVVPSGLELSETAEGGFNRENKEGHVYGPTFAKLYRVPEFWGSFGTQRAGRDDVSCLSFSEGR